MARFKTPLMLFHLITHSFISSWSSQEHTGWFAAVQIRIRLYILLRIGFLISDGNLSLSLVCLFLIKWLSREKIVVPADKPFITLSGTQASTTIITWGDGGEIFESPTLSILASDFVGRYLTIQVFVLIISVFEFFPMFYTEFPRNHMFCRLIISHIP